MGKKLLKYAGPGANGNLIAQISYILAMPCTALCASIGLKPNHVTIASLILAIASGVSIVLGNKSAYVALFLLSYYLDFVDGSLARMTGMVGRRALRVDHIADLIKILVVVACIGFAQADLSTWPLIYGFCSAFMFYMVLHHETLWVTRMLARQSQENQEANRYNSKHSSSRQKNKIWRRVKKIIPHYASRPLGHVLSLISSFNSHTLLIILLIAFDGPVSLFALIYLILLCMFQSLRLVLLLNSLPKAYP